MIEELERKLNELQQTSWDIEQEICELINKLDLLRTTNREE